MAGSADLAFDQRLRGPFRQSRKHLCVLSDRLKEAAVSPAADADGINERQMTEGGAADERRPQRHSTTHVMSDNAGLTEAPAAEEVSEDSPLSGQAYVLAVVHTRLAEAKHVPDVNLAP